MPFTSKYQVDVAAPQNKKVALCVLVLLMIELAWLLQFLIF